MHSDVVQQLEKRSLEAAKRARERNQTKQAELEPYTQIHSSPKSCGPWRLCVG